jgi:predicted nucleotidyltransferase
MQTVSVKEQIVGGLIPPETIGVIIRSIAERFSPHKIILFGSYATDHPTPNSDLDLFLIMDTDLPRYKRATAIRLLFQPSPCAMDILVYTPEEVARWNGTTNHIITEVLRNGKTVYERS